jgi:hypothetical protein
MDIDENNDKNSSAIELSENTPGFDKIGITLSNFFYQVRLTERCAIKINTLSYLII